MRVGQAVRGHRRVAWLRGPARPAATERPADGVGAERLGRRCPTRAAPRTLVSPRSSSSATRSENDASAAEVADRVGPPVALGVRRAGDQAVGVVDPEPSLLPCPGAPAASARAGRVEPSSPPSWKVSGETRIASTRPTLGSSGAPHPTSVDVGSDDLADQSEARTGRPRLARHVLDAAPGHRTGVEEVELEVVDARGRPDA